MDVASHFGRMHVIKERVKDYPELKIDLRLENRYVDIKRKSPLLNTVQLICHNI